jgi:NTP pyrophosphatase (non-canonical NTP hydrolase)
MNRSNSVNGQEKGTLARLTVEAGRDSDKWFGDMQIVHSIPHHTLALAGEVGELANLVKKIERGSLQMRDAKVRHAMAMELTDVFTYVLNLAYCLGIDLEQAYMIKRGENDKRFTEERNKREGK